MGVYIDAIVQAKVDGQWTTVDSRYRILRGLKIYWWLGYEASDGWVSEEYGVNAIALPRGLPENVTLIHARYDYSWLMVEEILSAPLPPAEDRGSDEPPSPVPRYLSQTPDEIAAGEKPAACNIAALRADLRVWLQKYDEVRLVFGFW